MLLKCWPGHIHAAAITCDEVTVDDFWNSILLLFIRNMLHRYHPSLK
jgi:hypothetical protein